MHEVLINRFGGLSLPRKSVVRFTECPIDDYRCLLYTSNNNTTTLYIHENICCDTSFESSQGDDSNVGSQRMFLSRSKKNYF